MAEPRVVATVVRIDGQVFARNADGEVRLLKAGDTLLEGEVVITDAGGRVELAYADGGRTSIPADSSVLVSEERTEATRPAARAAAVEDATIAQVIQAIETGQDLEQVLEDPAAGLAGGGSGEGSNFVRLLRISEGVEGGGVRVRGRACGRGRGLRGCHCRTTPLTIAAFDLLILAGAG